MSESGIRRYAASKRFSAALVERWLAAAPADGEALLSLADSLRLGENQLRDLFDALADVAARQGSSLTAVASGEVVRGVLARGLGRNEAIKALTVALRRLRYPQLSAAEQRLAALVRGLRLPAGVRLELPENLEGEQVAVTLRARSAAELRAQATALAKAADAEAVDEIFAVLEGQW